MIDAKGNHNPGPSSRDREQLRVEPIRPASGGGALHAFRVQLADLEGRCFITTVEAGQLTQLTTDWVTRALGNLGDAHGIAWLRLWLASETGLQLHPHDAFDPVKDGRDQPLRR